MAEIEVSRVVALAHQIAQSLAISALTEPNRQKSRRKKGFWAQKSQPQIALLNRNAALLSPVSEIARFLGSVMGIAIANRRNRCDFGALRL